METLRKDVRFAARLLRKNLGFTIVSVLVLAIGIGTNTAIFSVVDATLVRPLPYPESQRLVLVENVYPQIGPTPLSYPQFQFWQDQKQIFDQVLTYSNGSAALTGLQEPEQVRTLKVSASLLPTLGVAPVLGRMFLPEEEPPSGNPVAMLSEAFWRKHFHASPSAIGQKLTLNDTVFTVIGVVPGNFRMSRDFDLVLPLRLKAPANLNFLAVIGRLRPGLTLAAGNAALQGPLVPYKQADAGIQTVALTPYQEVLVGDSRPLLYILLSAVFAVLMIACANTANLLLARAASREKEIAIRISLGAGRMRLTRQLLTESILLSLTGGVLGVALAWLSLGFLTSLLRRQLPAAVTVSLDFRVLIFAVVLSVLTGMAFGLAPVLQLVRGNLHDRLKRGGRQSGASAGGQRLRHALVVGEIAVSLALLAGAGLLLRSMVRLLNVDKGFDPQSVVTMSVRPSPVRYSDPRKEINYLGDITRRVGALPGITSAGLVYTLPLSGGSTNGSVNIEGRQGNQPNADKEYVSGDYFKAMRIPLLKGRFFSDSDTADSPRVVIINQAFAEQFFAGQDPIGKHVDVSWGDPGWSEVIGVVGNNKQADLAATERPTTFMLYGQNASILRYLDVNLVARTREEPLQAARTIAAEIRQIDSGQAVGEVRAMEEVLDASLAPRRAPLWLFGAFSAIALFLAAIGIYGVLSYFVVQRGQEIGVRMALGAQRAAVLKMILGQGARLIGVGVVIGMVASLAAARALTSMLFGVKPTDVPTFLGVSLLLASLALLACAVPALRATRVDPLVVLRNE